ncbi:MAG: hypothetical protein PHV32_05435 [Eubacteriales bacterium]|nr:hypothetical protein [Eubacteriales bacterium]
MRITAKSIRLLLKKPFLILHISAVVLLFLVFEQINPLMTLVTGLIEISDADIFQNIISLLQTIIKPAVLPYMLGSILIMIVLSTVMAGFFIPGWLNVANNTLTGKKAGRKEFFEGYRKFFAKMLLLALKLSTVFWMFIIYLTVALVPLMIILRAPVFSRLDDLAISVAIVIISALILYFSLMFFRSYVIFWLPALASGAGKPFKTGKKAMDRNFWKLSFSFFIFDIIMVAAIAAFTYFEDSIYLFVAKWVFWTIYSSYYASYVFNAFKVSNDGE